MNYALFSGRLSNGFGNNGSVRDYFYDNSRGKLTYTNAVTQYYTAAHNRSTAYRVDSECHMGSVAASIQGPTPYEMLYPSESAR